METHFQLLPLSQGTRILIDFEKVAAHSGDECNDIADMLAVHAERHCERYQGDVQWFCVDCCEEGEGCDEMAVHVKEQHMDRNLAK